jgi:sulfite reductase alpha subunit-like flavoprotein
MKFTLGEVIVLFEELNGRMINRETGERTKGILSHKLSIRAKYVLNNELNKKLSEEVKHYEEARLEIFKELGKQDGDNIMVSPEDQPELIKRIQELESIEKNIDVPKLNVEELFSIETDDYFPILLEKLLAKEKDAKVVPIEG